MPMTPCSHFFHTFNRATCEGFPVSWTEYSIVLIFESGDSMIPSNYRNVLWFNPRVEIDCEQREMAAVQLGRQGTLNHILTF